MYHPKAEKLYYGLISFLLMMGFFVLSPNSSQAVSEFSDTVKNQIRIGWIQTVGDQSWFSDIAVIYESVDTFYVKSADAYIELVSNAEADADLVYIAKETYYRFGFAKKPVTEEQLIVANIPHFMEEPGIVNIIPEGLGVRGQGTDSYSSNEVRSSQLSDSRFQILDSTSIGSVAGATFDPSVWVDIKDAITGKFYCVAVYGGEVHSVRGGCSK